MNVYIVKLASPVETSPMNPGFSGKSTSHLWVTASSFEAAILAVKQKYPEAEIRGIDCQNYASVPIVSGN